MKHNRKMMKLKKVIKRHSGTATTDTGGSIHMGSPGIAVS